MRGTAGSAGTTEPDLEILLHTGPFHAAFRAAVRERGLTLDRLRVHLARRGVPIALSTLSDWQHGRRRPAVDGSLRAVRELEDVLKLRPRSLLRLLVEPATSAGAPPQYRPQQGIDERSGAIADVLDGLPGSREQTVDIVSVHEKVGIGPDGQSRSIWSRTVVRARRDGVDRHLMRYYGDPGCVIDRVELQALENCHLGTVRRHRAGLLVAELLFGETLGAGDTWVLETQVDDRTGQPSTEHAHGFRAPGQQYVIEVRFDKAALPVDCHSFAQPGLHDERHRTRCLPLNRHHAVHMVASGLTGGLVGIGWRWDHHS
jgi:hypothetical protein